MCGLWVLGDEEEEEEEEEEGRSLSKLGQPGREPPPGGRTGTRYRRLNNGETPRCGCRTAQLQPQTERISVQAQLDS
jgi:hypothetical protein